MSYHIKNNKLTITSCFSGDFKRMTKRTSVFLTDLKGQILFEQKGLAVIDISKQPKGCYIVFLTDSVGGLIDRIKVIKL